MSRFRRLMPLLGGRRGIRLIVPGYLDPRMTFARAQASGAMATALNADGTTWAEFNADVPRFTGVARRLLLEGQRTGGIRNARGEGAIAGTSGTLPTNWSSSTTSGGLTRSVVGYETINGVSCMLIRFAGTATGGSFVVLFEPAAIIAATQGQVFALSMVMRVTHAGDPPSELRLVSRAVPAGTDTGYPVSPGVGVLTRVSAAHTVPDAGNTSIRPGFALIHGAGQVIDTTVAVGLVQCELGAFASQPILPAVGTPAASTRGADLVSAPLSSLGIADNGACTVVGRFSLLQAAPAGVSQVLLHMDNGGDTSRVMLRNSPGSTNIVLTRTTAGVAVDSLAQSVTAGVPFNAGFSVDGAGNAAFSVNGGTALAVAGAPTSGFTTLRLGSNSGGAANLFGEMHGCRVLPFAVSGAELQRMVAEFSA